MALAGKFTFVGEYDGRRLYAETVASSKAAGAAAGDAYSSDFGKKFDGMFSRLRKQFVDEGRKNGLMFSKSTTDRISAGFGRLKGLGAEIGDNIGNGLRRAMGPIDTLRLKTMYLRDHLASLSDSKVLGPFSKLFNVFRRDGSKSFDEVGRSADGFSKKLAAAGNSSFWSELPYNGRQAIVIISAIAAAAGPIAVLGQAAAGGLFILAGAAAALAVGIAVLVTGFQNITGDLSKIPAGARPAAAALQGLFAAFTGMQQPIQTALLSGLAGPIQLITSTLIPVLQAGLVGIAGVLNGVLGQLATALVSPAAITGLQTLLAGFQPILASLGSAFITFGGAIGNIFIQALPFVQQFASWFAQLGQQFLDWTNTIAGQTAIQTFFTNTMAVFQALGPVIAGVGEFFSNLITPDALNTTTSFLGLLSQLLGPLGQMLDVFSNLQIFNLLAAALQLVMQGLQPLFPALSQIALLVSGTLIQAIVGLIPGVSAIAQAFVPLLGVLMTMLQTILPPLIPLIVQIATFLGQFLGSVVGALTPILAALIPVITAIMNAFMPIITAILPPLMSLINQLLPLLTPLISLFTALITPILGLIAPLLDLIGPILNPLIALLSTLMSKVVPILSTVIAALVPIVTGVANALGSVLIPIVKTVVDVLQGVITFLTGVFTGNWNKVWQGLGQIVSGIWNGIQSTIRGAVNGVVDIINGMIGGVNTITSKVGIPPIPKIPHWASGALLTGPTFGLAGEAGPEAIVPLNRPLSQVDPAVRGLSAIAQGKATVAPSGGGTGGGNVIFEAGSIVSPYADPALVAQQAADKVAEKIAG